MLRYWNKLLFHFVNLKKKFVHSREKKCLRGETHSPPPSHSIWSALNFNRNWMTVVQDQSRHVTGWATLSLDEGGILDLVRKYSPLCFYYIYIMLYIELVVDWSREVASPPPLPFYLKIFNTIVITRHMIRIKKTYMYI